MPRMLMIRYLSVGAAAAVLAGAWLVADVSTKFMLTAGAVVGIALIATVVSHFVGERDVCAI
jgi:hypothetical protein